MKRRQNEITRENEPQYDRVQQDDKRTSTLGLLDLIIAVDKKWTAALSICAHEDSHFARFRPLMKAIEISFHGVLWLVGTVVAFVMTHRVNDIELLVNLFILLILDLIVVGLTKMMFRRGRPSDNRMDMFATVSVDLFSFPSGHATRAAMVTSFLVVKVVQKHFAAFLIAFCCCVGLSRIMLGRHHVLDVFFGLVIGILEFVCYLPFWLPFDFIEKWLGDVLSHLHL